MNGSKPINSLNVSKTNYVLFNNTRVDNADNFNLTIANESIERKNEVKFLGLYLCNELGEVNAGWIPTRPASVDQVHTRNNRHAPLMV